jgi:hypothetical protein
MPREALMICSKHGAIARSAWLASLISVIGTIAALSSPAAAQTVSDSTFLDADWALKWAVAALAFGIALIGFARMRRTANR